MEIFPPKLENFQPLQNVPMRAILQKKLFLEVFGSGKFSIKVEKFPLPSFGLKFAKREGLDGENQFSTKWKTFHQKWKTFHLCRMFQFMWFWNIFFTSLIWAQTCPTWRSRCRKTIFAKVENFPPKSGKISTSAECSNSCDFGINFFFFSFLFSPKWINFHFFHQGSHSIPMGIGLTTLGI